jgi:hypothetical protein
VRAGGVERGAEPVRVPCRFLAAKAAEEVAVIRKTGVKAGKLPAY